MSLEFYKWIHLLGLMMLFCGLAGLWGSRSMGRSLSLLHGIGMLFLLVGGFGMMARMGIVQGWPGWIYVKLCVWLALGAGIALAKRKSHWGMKLIGLWIGLGALAAYMGIFKPL
jgi:hypothetical protein